MRVTVQYHSAKKGVVYPLSREQEDAVLESGNMTLAEVVGHVVLGELKAHCLVLGR